MKSFKLFLRKIARRLLLPPERLTAIAALDPSHIYVENVRALFGLSTGFATRLCELAVRQGFLEKRVQVLCPDQAVAIDVQASAALPEDVPCVSEVDGHYEETRHATRLLRRLEYYVFKPGGAI